MTQVDKNGTITTYEYDLNGNLVGDSNGSFYGYDEENRLVYAKVDGVVSEYGISTEGLRVSKGVGNDYTYEESTAYTIDQDGNVILENGDDIIRGHQALAKRTEDGSYYYYIYNGHGDVVMLVDESGNVKNSYAYDAWGKITSETETIPNSIKYAGEYYDAETGFLYLRNRMYDPATRRFTSEDPARDQLNWYVYCGNNPVIYVDPWGLNPRYVGDAAGLNLRNGAGTNNGIITAIPYGAEVNYTGTKRYRNGQYWAQVEYNGYTGWVAAKYLVTANPNKNYIFGQGNGDVANKPYGSWIISENGCELIAVYNALVNIGAYRDFDSIIRDAEAADGLLWLGGKFGSHPDRLGLLFDQYGISYTSTEDSSKFNDMLSAGGTYIVSFWNKGGVLKGIHTVMFIYDNDGSIRVFNYSNASSDANSYSSLDTYLNNQGNPIILYKVG